MTGKRHIRPFQPGEKLTSNRLNELRREALRYTSMHAPNALQLESGRYDREKHKPRMWIGQIVACEEGTEGEGTGTGTSGPQAAVWNFRIIDAYFPEECGERELDLHNIEGAVFQAGTTNADVTFEDDELVLVLKINNRYWIVAPSSGECADTSSDVDNFCKVCCLDPADITGPLIYTFNIGTIGCCDGAADGLHSLSFDSTVGAWRSGELAAGTDAGTGTDGCDGLEWFLRIEAGVGTLTLENGVGTQFVKYVSDPPFCANCNNVFILSEICPEKPCDCFPRRLCVSPTIEEATGTGTGTAGGDEPPAVCGECEQDGCYDITCSGVTSETCSVCNEFNGTLTMVWLAPDTWRTVEDISDFGACTSSASGLWSMLCVSGTVWKLYAAGGVTDGYVEYTCDNFQCNGTSIFTRIGGSSGGNQCNNWPDTVTVTRNAGCA